MPASTDTDWAMLGAHAAHAASPTSIAHNAHLTLPRQASVTGDSAAKILYCCPLSSSGFLIEVKIDNVYKAQIFPK